MLNTFYDSYRILMKVYGQKAFIKQAVNSEIIEPINRSAVIKICYGVVENDIYLEYVLGKLCDKRPKSAVRIILKIAIYNIRFLNKSPYAVTDSSVELLKKLGKGANAGFANAVLRKYISLANDIKLPENKTDKLSIKYSYPRFAVELLANHYGEETAERIMEYNTAHNYVRFADNVDGEKYLQKQNKQFEKTPFFNLFDIKNFRRNEDYDKGLYTFQSIGSVAICDIVPKGDILIDCCAAPGGKSVLCSNKFNKVFSCDLHEHRANLIEGYCNRMGVKNVTVKIADSTVFNKEFNDTADSVLCDCPCSGFGVVNENPDIKLNRDYSDICSLHEAQVAILENCSKYGKSGGYLIYSTCSVFNEENDLTVKAFAPEKHGFDVCEIESPLQGIKTQYGIQFLPHISGGAGFYVCKMLKH